MIAYEVPPPSWAGAKKLQASTTPASTAAAPRIPVTRPLFMRRNGGGPDVTRRRPARLRYLRGCDHRQLVGRGDGDVGAEVARHAGAARDRAGRVGRRALHDLDSCLARRRAQGEADRVDVARRRRVQLVLNIRNGVAADRVAARTG